MLAACVSISFTKISDAKAEAIDARTNLWMLIQRMPMFVKHCLLYSHAKSTTAAYKLNILTANPEP